MKLKVLALFAVLCIAMCVCEKVGARTLGRVVCEQEVILEKKGEFYLSQVKNVDRFMIYSKGRIGVIYKNKGKTLRRGETFIFRNRGEVKIENLAERTSLTVLYLRDFIVPFINNNNDMGSEEREE